MSDMPFIEKGRVLIPTAVAVSKLKPKAGGLRVVLEEKIPGIQWDGKNKIWWVAASEEAVANTNKAFNTALKSEVSAVANHITAFPFKTKPRDHQLKALVACGSREAFAYFMEPGLGKTKVAIDDMQILHRDGEVADVIVFCPKSIMGTWVRELGTHGYNDAWEIYRWDPDSGKPHAELVHPAQSTVTMMRWMVMNIDCLSNNESVAWRVAYSFVMRSVQCAMIVDESTTIKNIEAKRTLNALLLGQQCRYRRILTGTPIGNTPLDLYAQLTFLDETIFYGWSYRAFKDHFAITGGYKQREIYGYCNQDELAATLSNHSFRATKAECLDLPPRVYQIREIELSKATWKLYDQLVEDTLISLSEEKEITVDMVTKKIIKLRQLMGGWVLEDKDKVPPGQKRQAFQMAKEKLEDFKDFLMEIRGQKMIVWCQFVHEVINLHEVATGMGFKVVKYYGQMGSKERDVAENAFERGDADLIIIQNDTGSMGLTLNAAALSYIYSNPTYLLNRMQLEDRNYRDGQTKSVTLIDSICVGTVDQTIYEVLMDKKQLSDAIMKAGATKNMDALRGVLYPKRTAGGWKGQKRDA